MKYVYVVEIMQLSNIDNKFHAYDMEVIAPDKIKAGDKGVKAYIQNMIECNKGYDIVWDEKHITFRRGEKATSEVTYNCMSAPVEEGQRLRIQPQKMRMRYVIRKMEINKHWL